MFPLCSPVREQSMIDHPWKVKSLQYAANEVADYQCGVLLLDLGLCPNLMVYGSYCLCSCWGIH